MRSLRAPLTRMAATLLLVLVGAACTDKPEPTAATTPSASNASFDNDSDDGSDDDASDNSGNSRNLRSGAVYTATDAIPNAVVAYYRASDGTLSPAGTFPTGGDGSNGNLPGQGSVVLSGTASAEVAVGANRLLFVTNTGSNTLSVFRIRKNSLELVDNTGNDGTNGLRPLSVTVHQNLVYVVNQATANITGFRVTAQGKLTPIPGSTRSLSSPVSNPAQVGFSPDGRFLVTEGRESQIIDVYLVDRRTGLVGAPRANLTNGLEPFAFTFDRKGHLFMTEGKFVTPGAGSTSSYDILNDGTLQTISLSVANLQGVPCWVVITANQKAIFEANAVSSTISSYTVKSNGQLVLKESIAGTTGSFPGAGAIDVALSNGSGYLYSASAAANGGTIVAFKVNSDETLTPLGLQGAGLPPTISGLAAR